MQFKYQDWSVLEKPPPPSWGKPRADYLVTPHSRWGRNQRWETNPFTALEQPGSSHGLTESGLYKPVHLGIQRKNVLPLPSSKPTTFTRCTRVSAEQSRNLQSHTLRPSTVSTPSHCPVLCSSPVAKLLHIYSMDCRAAALARAKTSFFFLNKAKASV